MQLKILHRMCRNEDYMDFKMEERQESASVWKQSCSQLEKNLVNFKQLQGHAVCDYTQL